MLTYQCSGAVKYPGIGKGGAKGDVTHGICRACKGKYFPPGKGIGTPPETYIAKLPYMCYCIREG